MPAELPPTVPEFLLDVVMSKHQVFIHSMSKWRVLIGRLSTSCLNDNSVCVVGAECGVRAVSTIATEQGTEFVSFDCGS